MMRDPIVVVTHWSDGHLNTAGYTLDELDRLGQDVKASANTIGVTRLEVILPGGSDV